MNFRKVALFATLFALAFSAPSYAALCGFANQLYCQEFDGTGNAYSSQNDPGSFGLFAQVYDNFQISGSGQYNLNSVHFYAEYFNSGKTGDLDSITVNLYSDPLQGPPPQNPMDTITVPFASVHETLVGNFGGFDVYSYSIDLPSWAVDAGTTYWLDVYANLTFPPQWGWSSGTGGDGVSLQDFFGARSQLAADMAFGLDGTSGQGGVPEPGTLVMLGTGVLGVAGAIRRKLF